MPCDRLHALIDYWASDYDWRKVEACYGNLIYFNELTTGGHFAAWEQPRLFTAEVRAGFRSLR